MAKMTESRLAEMIFQDLLADASLSDEGTQWNVVGNQIFVTIGPFDENGVQVDPQRFVITIVED